MAPPLSVRDAHLQAFLDLGAVDLLLAMRKVEGSNPFSRFRKGPHLQAFSWAQSAGAFASPGTQWAPGGQNTAGATQNNPVCRHFLMTRTIDLLPGLLLPTRQRKPTLDRSPRAVVRPRRV